VPLARPPGAAGQAPTDEEQRYVRRNPPAEAPGDGPYRQPESDPDEGSPF